MEYYEKIAKILRVDKDAIRDVESRLERLTGKLGVMDAIGEENEKEIKQHLETLELPRAVGAKKAYQALIEKIRRDDEQLFEAMHYPRCDGPEGCRIVTRFVAEAIPSRKGFFLKKEKFIEILEKQPPRKILSMLGYSSVSQMVAQEDLLTIAAALRFVEGSEWVNTSLLPHYADITPADFEERDIEIITLDARWKQAGREFMKKKFHNVSHLKELGVIFVIPESSGFEGELMRTVSLATHYIFEILFYSSMFKEAMRNPDMLPSSLTSLLRGDTIDSRDLLQESNWLVIQRYLAKDDENDWRLLEPHVNPEAIHWEKAEKVIAVAGEAYGVKGLSFWQDLNWVGDYFTTNAGIDVLVSFNLIDTSMSLVQEKEMVKYLYHHQEALWNKVFSSYYGEDEMERLIKENLIRGFITPRAVASRQSPTV